MQPVHHLFAVGMAGQEVAVVSQGIVHELLVERAEISRAGGYGQVVPGHGGFELVAAGRPRPAGLIAIDGLFAGQSEDGVKIAVPRDEVARHGTADSRRAIQELLASGGAPCGQQATHDDARIEEVSEGRRIELEGHGAEIAVPCSAGQKARTCRGAVEVAFFLRERVEVDEGAHGVTRDLGGDRVISGEIDAVIASNAAVRFLDAGVEKPFSSTGKLWEQTSSVAAEELKIRSCVARSEPLCFVSESNL